ncbi:glycoside hydrolase family 31 protein [Bifidobacterium callitrichos]|uniref:Alpha-glucosidase n=1 Tax=Bifidobacterium callitrichos DSM 23973 TaxID=1437609 RepID=A0A087A9J5_9BIFI|nr:glycoside hydrolase family 31 protein [Bifidobacterium callitrichos]KFI55445.1 alpha-glucosidase [Bifidobacterium callitrichos DSM 23973]
MIDTTRFTAESAHGNPLMNPKAVVRGDHWRIGILTDSLIRLEWSDDGDFVDDRTQIVVNRDFGGIPDFTVRRDADGWLDIETTHLRIRYDGGPFSAEGLNVTVKDCPSQHNTWHYGAAQSANRGGTTRTLDQIDGAAPLDPGLISGDGWMILDDSHDNVIRPASTVRGRINPFGEWVFPKPHASTDLYLFGHSGRIHDALRDYHRLTGPVPLLPRWAFGNWWSRYHRYTADEYRTLVERFEREGLPFTVAVIDMDWHTTDVDPAYGSGWTGFTWNRELFPDPDAFLEWLHAKGMRTTLNLHPRDGVRAFEDCYERVATAVGVDPATGSAIEFDAADPTFMAAYFDEILHPMERQGVDFWWIDWQQGGITRQKGLDPLWMLNHLHYLDSAREGRRPITFSRYSGYGSHRYPIGFSGDTVVSWESLKFQPYFTAMASNIGYGWWSHDIGGHMFGYRDEELEARWYQLGTFSPINRLHSTDSPFNGKEPWNFHEPVRTAMVDALRLRHRLIPYLYTMNRRAAFDGLPLVEPMYWNHSGGNVPTEFQFGTELIVSPILEPADPAVRRAKANVWFPHGEWYDLFDGRRYTAEPDQGRTMEVWRGIERMPAFAKAGGIIPMQRLDECASIGADVGTATATVPVNDVSNPSALDVLVFPGQDGSFTLWEDDGAVGEADRWTRTDLALDWTHGAFTVDAAAGECTAVPARRAWRIILRGVADPATGLNDGPSTAATPADAVTVLRSGDPLSDTDYTVSYEEPTLSLVIDLPPTSIHERLRIEIDGLAIAPQPIERDAFAVLDDAQMLYFTKERAWELVRCEGVKALASLHTLEMPPGDYGEPQWFSSHMPQGVIEALSEVLLRG